jgi:S1-C subfamily serine protease
MREGFLIASTFEGELLPVSEILAADKATDTCILRVKSPKLLEPLPLNVNVRPGDDAWCLSDPLGRDGYFTKGIVNRFFQHVHPGRKRPEPIRMNVSTDWAPGSSGAAVLDTCGNAIGHVSLINAEEDDAPGDSKDDPRASGGGTLIVFHDAVRAADVLALIKAPQTKKP